MNVLKMLISLLLLVNKSESTGKSLRLIYEKDVSEYCRRRVVPSIFLGRHVIEANARILQFSRLELPYSCFISVRTEAGSSIVMMIEVAESKEQVQEACKKGDQLLVYEMGETFGGYWGPWPETVFRLKPLPNIVYTLKTTEYTTTPMLSTTEEEQEELETTQTPATSRKKTSSEESKGDYVEVEVPLVNISVSFVPSKENQFIQKPHINSEELFDLHNDVTPIEGVAYDRSIVPLVQFQLGKTVGKKQKKPGRPHSDKVIDLPLNFNDADIIQNFTPDSRLTLPQLNPTSKRRNKPRYQPTKRLNFKKHRTLFHSQRHYDRRVMFESITRKNNEVRTYYMFPTTRNVTKDNQDSWRVIEDLLKKLNKTKANDIKTTLSFKENQLLEKISDTDHKISAYLSSNLSIYDTNTDTNEYNNMTADDHVLSTRIPGNLTLNITKNNSSDESATKKQTEIKSTTTFEDTNTTQNGYLIEEVTDNTESTIKNVLEDIKTDEQVLDITTSTTVESTMVRQRDRELYSHSPLSVSEPQSSVSIEIITLKSSSSESVADSKSKIHTVVKGSMVGHESWENLVQAAPEMVVLLNQTVADVITIGNASEDSTNDINEVSHKNKTLQRMKRNVHAIAIENAQPHNRTTSESLATTTEQSFDVADMQDFAQLVELQDDEVNGRIALRNLNHYVGPTLFNLCEAIEDDTMSPVHLFNSSRIVLSPSNFTFTRMKIILTAARALLSGEMRCPRGKIECQVSGARVCMDNMVACDNVPNCGSYEIYDEDRLTCGQTAGFQQNVFLAAFTSLAVLLTIIYAIHYWLKRCVPKVADAFFVYSDGIENVLYLESIMRSPHDMGEGSNLTIYHRHLYDDLDYEDSKVPRKNVCRRFIRKLCCCFRKSSNKETFEETETVNVGPIISTSKRYSFAEQEIQRMIDRSKDIAVQTGTSLEIQPLEHPKDRKTNPAISKQPKKPKVMSYDSLAKITDSLLTLEEPLPENHTDDLSLLKFFKENRIRHSSTFHPWSNPFEYNQNNLLSKSSPDKENEGSRSGTDSPSEKEIGSHCYDLPSNSEPGPSRKNLNVKEQIPPISRHLRFNEVTTTIPAGRYTEDEENNIRNNDGRRVVALVDRNRRSSRLLDTIEEDDEQVGSSKAHRNFWGKTKKSKKKTRVTLR